MRFLSVVMRHFLVLTAAFTSFTALAETEKESPPNGLYTNVYTVRPDFFDRLEKIDPVLPPVFGKKAFEKHGVTFPDGGSVVYNQATSQLTVRSSEDQMKLVETLVAHVNGIVEKQIYITLKEVTVSGDAADKLGFDWLLGPENPTAPAETPSVKGIVTDTKQSFFEEFSRPPSIEKTQSQKKRERSNGISGVFTDPQYQVMIRALSKKKGVDMLSAPSVMTRSNQSAIIQVGEKRWGIIPVVGADGFTIDLELYLPRHGEALYEEGEKPKSSAGVTIWDGQIVAWSEKIDDDTSRIVFIKAQLMDPAGMPINKEPKKLPAPPAGETIDKILIEPGGRTK